MANRRFIDFPIASTVGDNDIILIWQDGLNKQTTKATILTGISQDLASLTDVDLTGLTNGQILRYNSVTSKWENTDQGNLDLNDLNDVTIVSPSNGQVLVYNSSTGKWENSSGGYVPYIGAVTTVDLGAQQLQAGHTTLTTNGSTETLTINHTSGSGKAINVTKGGAGEGLYVNKTSGSGNAATIVGTLEATTLVKTGGTSAQFLKADGSVDSTTYQNTADKGQPNGYASLDGNGKVPLVQINDALIGNVNFQGLWNASTNTPTLVDPPSSGTKGYYYIVSTGGTFAGITFEVGDWIISNGTAWGKVDNTDAVSSVFGRTGNVTASNGDYNTSQVTESGNLYYTDARSRAALSFAAGSGAYNSGTGVITIPTNNNQITNGAGYITSAALANYLPLTGGTLTGALNGTSATFLGNVQIGGGNGLILANPANTQYFQVYTSASNELNFGYGGTTPIVAKLGATGAATFSSSVTANSFIKSGGTSNQFLKADGSVDSTSYGTGTVTSVGLSSATSGVTIGSSPITTSGTITLAIATASGSQNGLLSSTDWTTFNSKQNALTNPVTGTGTTNYLPKFTGASTIGNSVIQDNSNSITVTGFAVFNRSSLAFTLNPSYAGGNVYSQLQSTGDLALATGGDNNRFYINTSGNVLIGSPPAADNGARLQVSGTSTFSNIITANSDIHQVSTGGLYWGAASTYVIGVTGNTANGNLSFITGSTVKLTIASTGAATFSSSVTAGNELSILAGDGAGKKLYFTGGTTKYNFMIAAQQNVNNALEITPSTAAGGSTFSTPALTITSSGSVGIGTSTPQSQLHLSSTAPIMSFTDTNSFSDPLDRFMIRAGANQGNIQWYDNSSATTLSIMTFLSSGNVGIGTTSPGYRLVVNSATDGISAGIAGSTYGIRFDNGGTFSSGMSTIHGVNSTLIGSYQPIMLNGLDVRFGTSATERMRITSGGNVLIGTDVDDAGKLKVLRGSVGTVAQFRGAATDILNIDLDDNAVVFDSRNVAYTAFENQGTERWRITSTGVFQSNGSQTIQTSSGALTLQPTGGVNLATSSGKVGIGTTAVTSFDSIPLLVVGGGTADSGIVIYTSNATSGYLQFADGTSGAEEYRGFIKYDHSTNAMSFSTNSTARTEAEMTITSGGNLLVGTTTDNGARLQVEGTASFNFANNSSGITFSRQTIGELGSIINSGSKILYQGTGSVFINADSDSNGTGPNREVSLGNRGVAYMTITSSGNVGIGTTSPTTYSGYSTLSLNGSNGGLLEFKKGDVQQAYITNAGDPVLQFVTNASERMRITSSGNVLIGTTTDNGARLQVSGTSTFGGTVNINTESWLQFQGNNVLLADGVNTYLQASGSGQIRFRNNSASNLLTLASTGAATFSSSVTAASLNTNRISSTTSNPLIWNTAGVSDWFLGSSPLGNSTSDLSLYSYGTSSVVLNIVRSTGAATFSSSVTSGTHNINNLGVINLNSQNGFQLGADSFSGGFYIYDNTTGVYRFKIANAGAATFSSSVTATSFFESSDASLKTLVVDNYQAKGIDSVVAKLYIKNGKEELGYYAQDLQGVLPSAVSKGSDGLLNLSYREVHTAKIAYLEEKIKQLENELGRISK